ncbi:MAG: hypothetical protein IPG61_02620 [bacterium]|nr:hypothetical protein [bacterium]
MAMIAAPGAVIAADPEHFARSPFFWSATATLLTVPLGVLFASLAWRQTETEADESFAREPAQLQRPDLFGRMLAFGAIAAVALSVAYLLESGTPPLLAMIQQPGEYLLLRDLREDSFKLLDSPLRYFYYVLRTFGWPFINTLSLVRALRSHQAKWHLATTVVPALGSSTHRFPLPSNRSRRFSRSCSWSF